MSTEPEPIEDENGETVAFRCAECHTRRMTKEKAVSCCAGADGVVSADPSDSYRVYPDGIDGTMKRLQWVCWQLDGDNTKVPKRPDNPRRSAKSNDATTWTGFDDALRSADDAEYGIGLPFAQASPFVALDIDTPDGDDWVPDLDRLGGAVIERSPSGNLRIYLRDVDVPDWWTNQGEKGANTREVGIYDDSGYVTVTGDVLEGHEPPIEDTSQAAFNTWLKEA